MTDIKAHLRIEDSESDYETDLNQLIQTANEWVFSNCHLSLINRTVTCYFDSFDSPLKLPLFPIQSVSAVQYFDVNGASQTVASYQTDLLQSPAKLCPAVGAEWPETQSEKVNPVSVSLISGYGATESSVPALAKHLIRLLVGHWFVNREAVGVGTTKEIEFSANELVKMIRVNEFEVL